MKTPVNAFLRIFLDNAMRLKKEETLYFNVTELNSTTKLKSKFGANM